MMNESARNKFLNRVKAYQDRDDPSGWCEQVYRDANGEASSLSVLKFET
jgi:hypothetical protein